ncbi:MAG: hypothetical protein JEZ08_12410 [Clostridiales bacterium]|nr:hypothetical protein [Clostridiales bacterium]
MKRIVSLLLIVMIIMSFVACGNDDLYGTWRLDGAEDIGIEILMTITEDQMEILGMPFDYSIKGNKIIIKNEEGDEEIGFKVSGEILTFTSGDEVQTFTRVEEK